MKTEGRKQKAVGRRRTPEGPRGLLFHRFRIQPSAFRTPQSATGQATVELALVMMTVLVPVTFGLLIFAEAAWTYHSLVTLTRQGARYAATHCWQDAAGSNVVNWMQTNAPPFIDREQLLTGGAEIRVEYWSHDLTTRESVPFTCGGSCTAECVPDSVTVSVNGYQFRHLLSLLGFPPIRVPAFSTTAEMESMGGNPDTGLSSP